MKNLNKRCRQIITQAGYDYDNWLLIEEEISYIIIRHKLSVYKKLITKDKHGKFTHSVDVTNATEKETEELLNEAF